MANIKIVKSWVSDTVKLIVEPHTNYDSIRAEETVVSHYRQQLPEDIELEVECINLEYNDDDTEVYTLAVSFILNEDYCDEAFS